LNQSRNGNTLVNITILPPENQKIKYINLFLPILKRNFPVLLYPVSKPQRVLHKPCRLFIKQQTPSPGAWFRPLCSSRRLFHLRLLAEKHVLAFPNQIKSSFRAIRMQIYDDESFVNCKAANKMIPFNFFLKEYRGNGKTNAGPAIRSGQ